MTYNRHGTYAQRGTIYVRELSTYFGLGALRGCEAAGGVALLDEDAEPEEGDRDRSMTFFPSESESDEDRADLLRRVGVLKGLPTAEEVGGGSRVRILLARRCAIFSRILCLSDLGRALAATSTARFAAARQISARLSRTRDQY